MKKYRVIFRWLNKPEFYKGGCPIAILIDEPSYRPDLVCATFGKHILNEPYCWLIQNSRKMSKKEAFAAAEHMELCQRCDLKIVARR